MRAVLSLLLCVLFLPTAATSEPNPLSPGLSGSENDSVATSPKRAWGDFEVREEEIEEPTALREFLLWFPNRFLDFIDIFRIDLGVGPAVGGVVRVTKWGQAGIRTVSPASLRAGGFGRDWPIQVEHSSEFGIGPAFVQSHDRTVCPGELGAGVDLFIVGGYGGICFDELFDFLGGLFLYDVKSDDLH